MTAAEIIQGLIAFFQALPALISLAATLGTWIKKISGNDPAAFISKVGQAFDQLNAAQTSEEKQDAAKSIADLIHKLSS